MKQLIPHEISLLEAIELTTRYRNNPATDLPLSETYGKSSIEQMLAYPGCNSFRIYYGRKADNSICSVLVAVDINGTDIIPKSLAISTSPEVIEVTEPIILENAFHCPPICPPVSPLNG